MGMMFLRVLFSVLKTNLDYILEIVSFVNRVATNIKDYQTFQQFQVLFQEGVLFIQRVVPMAAWAEKFLVAFQNDLKSGYNVPLQPGAMISQKGANYLHSAFVSGDLADLQYMRQEIGRIIQSIVARMTMIREVPETSLRSSRDNPPGTVRLMTTSLGCESVVSLFLFGIALLV